MAVIDEVMLVLTYGIALPAKPCRSQKAQYLKREDDRMTTRRKSRDKRK